ncbi:hypothetical protein IFM89_026561 [Coptis chinensis]|uniref:Uncharacterized protein n=1 Tax=Coptis chinensis TaxID=261450 RepID=A0A835HH49_9MAGN|nr:hypothetical protein IFM89_026561 [Coptis chinensis]
MSRHRRQASQALPASFNVISEEPAASMEVLADGGFGNKGCGSTNIASGTSASIGHVGGGTKKFVSDGQPPLANQVDCLGTNAKKPTVDGSST